MVVVYHQVPVGTGNVVPGTVFHMPDTSTRMSYCCKVVLLVQSAIHPVCGINNACTPVFNTTACACDFTKTRRNQWQAAIQMATQCTERRSRCGILHLYFSATISTTATSPRQSHTPPEAETYGTKHHHRQNPMTRKTSPLA